MDTQSILRLSQSNALDLYVVWSKKPKWRAFHQYARAWIKGGYLSAVLQGQRLTAIFRSLQETQQRRVFAPTDH